MLYCLYSTGSSSSTITRAYLSSSVLYSVGRLVVRSPQSLASGSGWSGPPSGIDEHADHHRQLPPENQIVHHVLRPHIALGIHERLAVVVNHEAGRNCRIVLRGNVDPIGMLRARIGVARQGERAANFTFGDALLRQRIGTQAVKRVGVWSVRRSRLSRGRRGSTV